MSVHKALAVVTSLITLCACSNDINVRSEWGSGMAQYGLTPVYPLRENVYVGDIYLVVHNPCENSRTKIMQMVLLGSIPEAELAEAFRKFYGDRPEFPATSPKPKPATTQTRAGAAAAASPSKVTANLTATGPGSATVSLNPASASAGSTSTSTASTPAATASQPTAGADDPIFSPANKPRAFERLRLAAFPDFSLGSSTRFDAGAGGLIGAFDAAIGIGGGKTSHLNVSVSGVEEAVIPAPVLTRAIRSFLPTAQAEDTLDTATIGKLVETLEDQMEQEPGCGNPVPKQATINFVNRVFYARTVTFDFGQNDTFAALVRASAASAAAGSGVVAPSTSSASTTGSTASGSTSTVPAGDPNAAALATQQATLANIVGSGAPGGTLSYGIATSGNVALKQTYDRPMAFGTDHTIGYLWSELLDERIARKGGGRRTAENQSMWLTPTRIAYRSDDLPQLARTAQTNHYFAQNRITPVPQGSAGDPCITDPKSLACDQQYSQREHNKPTCGRKNCGGETTRVPTDSVLK